MDPRSPRPSAVAVIVRVPWDSARPHAVGSILADAIRATLATREGWEPPPMEPPTLRLEVVAVGPQQINLLDEVSGLCTVTYPVGASTVLSVQPDGTIETRPHGSAGPYELAIRKPDRLIYAPIGPAGKTFLIPYADVLPNPE